MPNYVIFAGVNGAEKSTLYNTITPTLDLGIRINKYRWNCEKYRRLEK